MIKGAVLYDASTVEKQPPFALQYLYKIMFFPKLENFPVLEATELYVRVLETKLSLTSRVRLYLKNKYNFLSPFSLGKQLLGLCT